MAASGIMLCVLVAGVTALPGWLPAPGIFHLDHSDDHVGYALTVRVNQLKSGFTYMQAAQLVDNYLFEVTKRDDVVEFYGFWDAQHSVYVTTGTWRTAQGALDSYNAAISSTSGNYHNALTETLYQVGTVNAFNEYLEFHSTPIGGYVTAVELCTLGMPTVWNQTTMIPVINNDTIPNVMNVQPGVLDYSVSFPTLPVANEFYFTQSSWNHTTDATNGLANLQADFANKFGPNVFAASPPCVVYTDTILNFWHSAPGTTPGLSGAATATPAGALLVALALLAAAA